VDAAARSWPVRLGPVRTAIGDVALRPLRRTDRERWQRLRLNDEALIRRWDPTARNGWRQQHSAAAFHEHRVALRAAARRGHAFPFAVTVRGSFAGQVTVAGVQGFPVQSGWVGYWVGSEFTGHGVATLAVALGVGHALGAGGLHRVDATVAPENAASRRVLEHLGFRQEGLLRRYLDVDGAWRDHQLWALTVEEIPGGAQELLTRAHAAVASHGR
jgi:[ribosomal protein S5]-alanine N-acetyltransferase